MVKELPKQVMDLFNDPQSTKVLATKCPNGMLHTVVFGTLAAPEPGLLSFGNIMAKETHQNLQDALKNGGYASALAIKGMQAFQVRCKPKEYATSGPVFDVVNARWQEASKRLGAPIPLLGVWLFEPVEVIDQSAGMSAGKRL
jgi:hypothetical protein